MRIASCLTLLAALAAPAIAEANCYSVYDGQNRMVFQSTVAPIDLSMRIADAMRPRFPGAYMVMIPDESDCREFRSGGTVQPRFDNIGLVSSSSSNQVLQASPLLRGTRGTNFGNDPGAAAGNNDDIATREAVRSGTSINIKR